LWGNIRNLVKFGASEDEIWAAIEAIQNSLDDIDYENVFGENSVEFYDVEFGENPAWYWDDVMTTRKKGIINGYSDDDGLTGYFGPGDNVTYAEALKMTLEAAGYGEASHNENIFWYEGYLVRLDELSLPGLNRGSYEWNATAPRGDILMMVNGIFGLEAVDYVDGTFPDVSASDSIADDAMASYLAGIFTGAGETGNLNPNDFIDRASFAKVINVGYDYLSDENFTDTLKTFNQKL
ncbi:MAG: S-layer homology domain-containing protein, partial [bacterium]|nr:S-layer homology domain-containing protein [bacterium]